MLATTTEPTWINPDTVKSHQALVAAMESGLQRGEAAEWIGITDSGAKKMLEVFGQPREFSTYPCQPFKCETCHAKITRAPCVRCNVNNRKHH